MTLWTRIGLALFGLLLLGRAAAAEGPLSLLLLPPIGGEGSPQLAISWKGEQRGQLELSVVDAEGRSRPLKTRALEPGMHLDDVELSERDARLVAVLRDAVGDELARAESAARAGINTALDFGSPPIPLFADGGGNDVTPTTNGANFPFAGVVIMPLTITYNPNFGTTINFPAGVAGAASSQMVATPSGGSGMGPAATTTLNTCTASAGFTITNAPTNFSFVGNTTMAQTIQLSCTRGDAAQTGTLSCSETQAANPAVTRTWNLTCPQAVVISGPSLAYVPAPPGPVAFGNVTIPANSVQNIVVTLSGGAGAGTTTVGGCAITGANAAEFALVSTATLTFTAGTTTPQNVGVRFTPALPVGAKTASLACTETVQNGATTPRTWNLTGSSVQAPPQFSANPAPPGPVAFGQVVTGQSVTRGIVVSNLAPTGPSNLALVGCAVANAAGVTVSPTVLNVAPQGSGTLTLTYTPAAAASLTNATLTCSDPLVLEVSRTWNLTGTAVDPVTVAPGGPAPGSTINLGGTGPQNRSIVFANASAAAQALTCAITPAGTPFTVSPVPLNIPAGGTGTVTVSIPGNPGNFTGTLTCTPTNGAPISFTLAATINSQQQAPLIATASPSTIAFGGTSTLTTTGGSGTGAVTYAVTAGANSCSVIGNTLTGIGAGSCIVTATKAADANFNAITATIAVTVNRVNQAALIATASPNTIAFGGTSTLTTTGGSGSGVVIYVVTAGSDFCSISESALTATGVGTCTVTATKAADANYYAATATVEVVVNRANQATLTATATPASIPLTRTAALSATGGSGTGAVSYAVTTGPTFCAINGSTLTGTGVGTCTVTATKAGEANYNPATSQVQIQVLVATDLRVSKDDGRSNAIPGSTVVYDIRVGNAGPLAVQGVRLRDLLPAGLTDALWSCTPLQVATCPQTTGTGDIDQIVDLPVSGILRYELSARVSAPLGSVLTNTVTADPPITVSELAPADNSASDINDVVPDQILKNGFEPAQTPVTLPLQ